jgi:hypothetical protein
MEDGTSGAFTDTSGSTTGNASINIIPDPTGQFGGNVVRMRYVRGSTAMSPDVNVALRAPNTIAPTGLGQTLYFRGHVLIPSPAANMSKAQRKLIYWQRQSNDSEAFFFLKGEGATTVAGVPGQPLKIELPKILGSDGVKHNYVANVGAYAFDTRTSIEVRMTVDSAPNAGDGVLEIWVGGALSWSKTGTFSLMRSGTAPYVKYLVGDQTQHELNDRSILFDEYRYWKDLALSRSRIGP